MIAGLRQVGRQRLRQWRRRRLRLGGVQRCRHDVAAFPCILGPTGSGKSALALSVAKEITKRGMGPAEIVNADSMSLYEGMDIGTATPTADEVREVPHHLFSVAKPSEDFNVGRWLTLADAKVRELQSRGVTPVLVGGTHMYIKAFLYGLVEEPEGSAEELRAIRRKLNAITLAELGKELRRVDPISASRLHPNDRRRISRALEYLELTGRRLSDVQVGWGTASEGEGGGGGGGGGLSEGTEDLDGGDDNEGGRGVTAKTLNQRQRERQLRQQEERSRAHKRPGATLFGISIAPELNNARIDARVDEMESRGLVREAATLWRQGPNTIGKNAGRAIGYREFFQSWDATLREAAKAAGLRLDGDEDEDGNGNGGGDGDGDVYGDRGGEGRRNQARPEEETIQEARKRLNDSAVQRMRQALVDEGVIPFSASEQKGGGGSGINKEGAPTNTDTKTALQAKAHIMSTLELVKTHTRQAGRRQRNWVRKICVPEHGAVLLEATCEADGDLSVPIEAWTEEVVAEIERRRRGA